MKKVVIDARESGTSTGRYIDKLIEYLHHIKPKLEVVVLTKPTRLDFFAAIAPSFTVLPTSFQEFSFGEQLGFKTQIDNLQADLVHFGIVQQPILYRGKVITTIHDLTTTRFINPDKNPVIYTLKQQLYKFVIRRVAHSSKLVITPTEFVKDDLIAFAHIAPEKVIVTYESADAINDPPVALPKLRNVPFIMYVGRPMPHKNLPRLITAFGILRADHPDLILVLAGKKDSNYEALAASVPRELKPYVYFTDFVSEGQLRWLYEHCAAYIFPSLSEGFGLPGLEAMVHGAPVVSSSATCLPELYGKAVKYFDPLDTESMAESIHEVLSDETLRRKLIVAGKQRATGFSWQRMAEQTLALYMQLLK